MLPMPMSEAEYL